MEELLKKLKGYLAMDHELPFAEFQQYYSELMKALADGFETMVNFDRVRARYICQIVASNARGRVKQNHVSGKKFRKMAEKCDFWVEAIEYRLNREGLSKAEIEDMNAAVEKSVDIGEATVATDGGSGRSGEKPLGSVDKSVETLEKS